ncbi:MAG: hypothetical protein K1X74_17915 [Pirellulales bacterium]|nr:hypothetical protein [Pirellulales bacterium]
MSSWRIRSVSDWLARQSTAVFSSYAILAAFVTYFCMYAFRKPFAAASFEGETVAGLDLKIALVISQTLGYAISKYAGIKFCSEVRPARRAAALLLLICLAEVALVAFGLLPDRWKFLAMFANGLPLGMVWGMVVGFLEGRRTSELLLAGLSCSYILASGVVKDSGKALLNHGVTASWMPAVTGLLYFPPLVVALWMLDQLPRPTADDEALRSHRQPMHRHERYDFVRMFLPGLVPLLAVYFLLTAYRDFRDNFGIEIFKALGYAEQPAIFTRTEVPVAFGVMLALAALNLVRNNRWGLIGAYAMMSAGTLLLGVSTLLLDAGYLRGDVWMVLAGLGSYFAYVPVGSMLFDRVLASTRVVGTAVFAIYLADAIGYSGSVGVLLYKNFGSAQLSHLDLFRNLSYVMATLGTVGLLASCLYFIRRKQPGADATLAPARAGA